MNICVCMFVCISVCTCAYDEHFTNAANLVVHNCNNKVSNNKSNKNKKALVHQLLIAYTDS